MTERSGSLGRSYRQSRAYTQNIGRLPAIAVFCPVESAISSHAAELEQKSMTWLAQFGFFGNKERLRSTKSAEFAARVSPNGLFERLQTASDWDYWGFAFDDRSDNGGLSTDLDAFVHYAHRLLRALETPDPRLFDNDPLTAAIADISERFAAQVTPVQHKRWTAAHRAWLFGVAAQIGTTGTMDVNRYVEIRLDNAAGEVVTLTTELVGGYEVTEEEHCHPEIRALSGMARLIAALDNDLHSYAKTAAHGESDRHNIVDILAVEFRYGLHDATAAAVALRDRIMCRFLTLSDTVGTFSAGTRQYVRDLGHIIRGNIDWALSVPRYAVDDSNVSDFFSISAAPADDSTDAPGISCIDWWWDV
ncbi:hypothetical protein ACFYO1_02580 [Nocardia sp. NPDC006044]|uniref:terpene synthase family protein n=1 Tax=Nocardia sp. NPDC006044 TaxID=3364306 RepID=UPI0036C7443F